MNPTALLPVSEVCGNAEETTSASDVIHVDDKLLSTSPAIRRLIEEVECDQLMGVSAPGPKYDRTHNRHNR